MQFKSSLRAETNDVLEIQKADNDLLDKINQLAKTLDGLAVTYTEPSGVIKPYGGSTAPTGYLICDGAEISRATYAGLFSIIGTGFGSGNSLTTFNLPDLRETYPVGIGTRGSGVTDHDTFTLGQFKDDQIQTHKHDPLAGAGFVQSGAGASSPGGTTVWSNGATTGNPSTGARAGTTTRGKALGINYIIKT